MVVVSKWVTRPGGRNCLVDEIVTGYLNRNWQTKVLDTKKVTQLNLLRQKSVKCVVWLGREKQKVYPKTPAFETDILPLGIRGGLVAYIKKKQQQKTKKKQSKTVQNNNNKNQRKQVQQLSKNKSTASHPTNPSDESTGFSSPKAFQPNTPTGLRPSWTNKASFQ